MSFVGVWTTVPCVFCTTPRKTKNIDEKKNEYKSGIDHRQITLYQNLFENLYIRYRYTKHMLNIDQRSFFTLITQNSYFFGTAI
jgi:hypothetical protein